MSQKLNPQHWVETISLMKTTLEEVAKSNHQEPSTLIIGEQARKLRKLNHTTVTTVVSDVSNLQAQFLRNRHIRMLIADLRITAGFPETSIHLLRLLVKLNQSDLMKEAGLIINFLLETIMMAGADLAKRVDKVGDGQQNMQQLVKSITSVVVEVEHMIPTVVHMIPTAMLKKFHQKRS